VGRDRLRRTLRAAEDERRRWARELHDETLQSLGGLRVLLSSALRSGDDELLRTLARTAVEQLDTDIESLRGLISELRPATLDELGLQDALLALCERVRVTHGIEISTRVELDGRSRLDPELETIVYRLVQEALNNASRHGHPERIALDVVGETDDVRVSVRDDGCGFDPSQPSDGFGLAGMRERVSLARGRFELTSSPAGTEIHVVLPAGT
jgi:signal transduction histidine kinase